MKEKIEVKKNWRKHRKEKRSNNRQKMKRNYLISERERDRDKGNVIENYNGIFWYLWDVIVIWGSVS